MWREVSNANVSGRVTATQRKEGGGGDVDEGGEVDMGALSSESIPYLDKNISQHLGITAIV